jgi:imidazolonepropionase-like amidohydrolase
MKIPKNTVFRLAALVFGAALALAAASASGPAGSDVGPTYAVRNCKIVPVAGPDIEKGTIVIRDGLIEAIGPADKVKIPDDAEIVEAEGLTAYPGLISAHSSLFLETPRSGAAGQGPPAMMRQAQQTQEEDKFPPGPGLRVLDQIEVKKPALESYHKAGITTALVAPVRGIFQGQSVLLNLNGETARTMVLRNPVALHINFTTERGSYPSSLMGTIAHIRQTFLDTQHYALHQAQYAKVLSGMKRPEYDPNLEALLPYVRDKKPVVFQCNDVEDLKRALKIVDEFKLNAVLAGANEAWREADLLKKSKVPLFVTLDFQPPRTSKYVTQGEDLRKKAEAEIYPANAASLAKAGVPFALTTLNLADGPAFLRNVQGAIKAGLSKDEALKALTLVPAKFLGLDRQLGSLEPGKIANVLLLKGEIFGEKVQASKVFVDGVLFSY